jgi:hypothetical protein
LVVGLFCDCVYVIEPEYAKNAVAQAASCSKQQARVHALSASTQRKHCVLCCSTQQHVYTTNAIFLTYLQKTSKCSNAPHPPKSLGSHKTLFLLVVL